MYFSRLGVLLRLSAMVSLTAAAITPANANLAKVGDKYFLKEETKSSYNKDGSSGNSSGGGVLVEEVIEIRQDGWVVEYSLPEDTPDQQKLSQWQFPAKIFKRFSGEWEFLNEETAIARRDKWLSQSEIPKEACNSYVFTWTLVKIECDPNSAIGIAQSYDTGFCEFSKRSAITLFDGAMPVILEVTETGANGFSLEGKSSVDASYVIQADAKNDVIIAQINGDELSYSEALSAREKENVSGNINVSISSDINGCLEKKIISTDITKVAPDGQTEIRESTQILTRKLLDSTDY